jgi:enamine deaminase RidA (YjgF/YER057c/UK114 family)
MAGVIDGRIRELGIKLPPPAAPVASYVPWTRTGNQVWIAGQGPFQDGELHYNGRVGDTVSLDDAVACARIVGLNILAQLKDALDGDLDRVTRCIKLGGFVQCTPDFTDQPKVINGASDLMVEVFGDAGRHARFAVGAPVLPMNTSVEIDAIFEAA